MGGNHDRIQDKEINYISFPRTYHSLGLEKVMNMQTKLYMVWQYYVSVSSSRDESHFRGCELESAHAPEC